MHYTCVVWSCGFGLVFLFTGFFFRAASELAAQEGGVCGVQQGCLRHGET